MELIEKYKRELGDIKSKIFIKKILEIYQTIVRIKDILTNLKPKYRVDYVSNLS